MLSKTDESVSDENKGANGNGVVAGTDDEEFEMPVPPDGGWGWIVVTASFFIHAIVDGVCFSFAVLFLDLREYFGTSIATTSWIGPLVTGMTLSTGPFACALTNKYGCRVVTIAGTIITFVGFIVSIFTPNIYFMFFSFGIVAGFGFGLIYLPAIVSVGYYFENKRAFATGLAVCGSGVGKFVFAFLYQYLSASYGWKGTVLIISGVIANMVMCGAVFRPLQPVRKDKSYKKADVCLEEKQALTLDDNQPEVAVRGSKSEPVSSPLFPPTDEPKMIRSVGNIHSTTKQRKVKGGSLTNIHQSVSESQGAGVMYRKDISYSGSIMNMTEYKTNPSHYATSVTSLPSRLRVDSPTKRPRACRCCSNEMYDGFRKILDFTLLTDPIFYMFVFSNFLTSTGFYIPFSFLTDYAQIRGIDFQMAAFLYTVIGIADIVGRVLFGFVSDVPFIRPQRLHVYNTSVLVCGIATALAPLAESYGLMVVYGAVFGVTVGSYVSLTSVILVDLFGLEKLTSSFGITLLFRGGAFFFGRRVTGWLIMDTYSYDISFIVSGITIGVSGFMLYFIPLVQKATGRHSHYEVGDPAVELPKIELAEANDSNV